MDRERTKTLELIEEVEGHTDKGKLFLKSDKNTIANSGKSTITT